MSFTKQLSRVRLDEVISALLLVIAKKWEVWRVTVAGGMVAKPTWLGNDATLEQDMAKGDNENSRLLIFPQAQSIPQC